MACLGGPGVREGRLGTALFRAEQPQASLVDEAAADLECCGQPVLRCIDTWVLRPVLGTGALRAGCRGFEGDSLDSVDAAAYARPEEGFEKGREEGWKPSIGKIYHNNKNTLQGGWMLSVCTRPSGGSTYKVPEQQRRRYSAVHSSAIGAIALRCPPISTPQHGSLTGKHAPQWLNGRRPYNGRREDVTDQDHNIQFALYNTIRASK
ncbi:hypothetical protein NPX13_g4077 [Xylaria arbuscula]|uniref:Uncharacterized protein n=1 Tax=Xylaria arbuscula TaxID=114810 RepID=A0A9W8TNZ4_9PEZI|nr:hypothetical protein NPX13_g4077 [Xylaria arbuscula]